MRFSIITVCFNADEVIEKTIRSLLAQNNNDFEYIIKDGLSTDHTLDIATELLKNHENVRIISTKDSGIYDAMNEAVRYCKGDYIFFLNAGDRLADPDVLTRVADALARTKRNEIVYGDVIEVGAKDESIRHFGSVAASIPYYLVGGCICHQAIFAPRQLLSESPFYIEYSVCADREWQIRCKKKGISFLSLGFPITYFETVGYSSKHVHKMEQEISLILKTHFPYGAWIYTLLLSIKRNSFFAKVITSLDRIFFKSKNGKED